MSLLKRICRARVGQSMIEYIILITLTAGAIMIMYKFVLRSVWGGIRSWEAQVDDSLHEKTFNKITIK